MTEIGLLLYLIGGVCFTFLSPRSCWSTDGYRPRQPIVRLAATVSLWPIIYAFPKLISDLDAALLDTESLAFKHRCAYAADALQRTLELREQRFLPESLLETYLNAAKCGSALDEFGFALSASSVISAADDDVEVEGRTISPSALDLQISFDLETEFNQLPSGVQGEVKAWLRFVLSHGSSIPSPSNLPPTLPMYAGLPMVPLKNCALVYEFGREDKQPIVMGIIWQD